MNSKVRWGGIARRRTIPDGLAVAGNAELAAVHDVNPAVNAEVAAAFGARPAASVAALLATDLDAVYLASPPGAHREQTLACARAGKHVLCEKPLGLTVAEATEMIAGCQAAGVRLGTAFMMRFHAQHRAALHLIEQGQLGEPVFARAQLSCWYPPIPGAWRQDATHSGGGSLMDMGGHCIDLLEMFFGPVAAVSCTTAHRIHPYPVEDSALATLQFANGALGLVDTFFCIRDESSRNVLELYGSNGSIHASGTLGQGDRGEMRAQLQAAGAGYDAQQARSATAGLPLDPPPVNMYRAEIEEFSQAILDRREPANHAELGLRSQRVLVACYESARSGRRVALDTAAQP
jgi:predicted dehydrogenase